MQLSVDSNEGLFSAYFTFKFSEEEMKDHLDGIYSAYFLFKLCFMKIPTPEQALGMSYIDAFSNFITPGLPNFVIQTRDFSSRCDNDVLMWIDKICDVILLLEVDTMKYHESIDKDKVISGYSFVKQTVLALKQELKDKKIKITHSYTDPFD